MMKIEQFLEDSLNNKAFVLKKKHGALRTICTFCVLAWLCIACFGFYIEQQWILFACTCILTLGYVYNFYVGADYFLLALPQSVNDLIIYKIGDDYFAGSDLHQAKLFAAITNRQQHEIESINCYSFYKQTQQQ
jgi:hypothetical protein